MYYHKFPFGSDVLITVGQTTKPREHQTNALRSKPKASIYNNADDQHAPKEAERLHETLHFNPPYIDLLHYNLCIFREEDRI